MYSRKVDGAILTLSATGWLYDNTFVLYDLETESLWYHLEGEQALTCIQGFYADKKLPELPSYFIRWPRWIENHPNSKFLKKVR